MPSRGPFVSFATRSDHARIESRDEYVLGLERVFGSGTYDLILPVGATMRRPPEVVARMQNSVSDDVGF